MKNVSLRARGNRCVPVRLFASLGLLAVSASALAQTVPSLPDTVVTASRVDTPITDVIADVTYIDRETLERAGQSSLREILGQQPGVQWISNGSYRSSTGIFLRGAAANQTVFLVDGIRIGSATSGSASVENIPLDRIDHIEILRGAASALYGPDAVGGVVQISTRKAPQSFQASVNLGAGTDGQQQAGVSLGSGTEMFSYSVGVSQEKATGINVMNSTLLSGYNADADGFDSTSWDAKLVARLAATQTVTLSALKSDTNYMFDRVPSPNPLGLTKATADARAKPSLTDVAVKWAAQWTPDWTSTVLLGNSVEQSVTEYYRIADGRFGGSDKYNTQRDQLSWQNDLRFGTDLVTALLEQRKESVDSSTVYKVTQRDITAAMLSYAWNRAAWNALAVLRNDENSQFGSFTNWAVSGGYKVSEGLRTVASLGTSFRAPTFNELYFPGFGNISRTPQRNRSTEVGLKYDRANLSWSAIAYQNEIQGYIESATNTQRDRAVLRGATLSAQLESGNTAYSVSYDYADPRSYSTTPAQNDLRLVRVAQNMLKAGINHRIDGVTVFAEALLSSEREDAKLVGTGRETLAGYTTLNLGANWKVRKDVKLQARVNNATDAQYMLANGYSMPGRNFFVSMVWTQ